MSADALKAAEDAWTRALQDAAGNHGDWGHVRQAAEVVKQITASIRAAEERRWTH